MKYLITGSTGFLGKHLCSTFEKRHLDFIQTTRQDHGDLTQFQDWSRLFKNIDCVIHAAAKAHDMSGSAELKNIYTEVNLNLTRRLAEQAKAFGVKKFIFISTIKVNGELTQDKPFTADDAPKPTDDYGISKYLAEKELMKLHEDGVFEVTVIRPCLIYGAGAKANLNLLVKLIKTGLPLPFGLVQNKRSFVSVGNLIDLILNVSTNKKASGQIFLVSDGADLSLKELIINLSQALNTKTIFIPLPIWFLKIGLFLIGKKDLSGRLFSNLQVDISKTKNILSWNPPEKPADAFKSYAKQFD